MPASSASSMAEQPKLPPVDMKAIKAFHKSLASEEQKQAFEEMMRGAGIVKKKKKRQAGSLRQSASAPELPPPEEFPKPYTVNFDGKRPDPKTDPLALTVGRLNVSLWGNVNPAVYPQMFPLTDYRRNFIDRSKEHDDDGRNKEFNFVKNDMSVYTQNYHQTKSVLRLGNVGGQHYTSSPSYI
jgi:hypothetical protein